MALLLLFLRKKEFRPVQPLPTIDTGLWRTLAPTIFVMSGAYGLRYSAEVHKDRGLPERRPPTDSVFKECLT